MALGVDVRLDHTTCDSHDAKCLDEQRIVVPEWMHMQRRNGWTLWLGGQGHGDGKAHHYWLWDVDSRGKYFEYTKFYNPGDVPSNWGDLHKGRGWQLPMLGVFYFEPSSNDLIPLKRNDDDGDCTCDNGPVLTALSKIIDILEDLEDELL
jgi:hypothetical protein